MGRLLWVSITTIVFVVGIVACISKEEEQTEFRFEAEEGILNGVQISSQTKGYLGDGYVTGFDNDGDTLIITVDAPSEAIYDFRVGYASPNGEKETQLSLNGNPFGNVKLPQTTTFTEINGGKLMLNEGSNQVTFTSNWGWYDIDYIKIQKAQSRREHQVKNVLVDPNATKEALALHRFLVDNYGKYILSGQQTLTDALKLKWDYGKLPAVVGFDLIEYSPTRVENGSTSKEIEHAIQWHALGGISTFAWHWNAPTDLINSDKQPWWKGFYTEGTTFDIEQTLNNPESEAYKLLLRDIDAIAVQLKLLQDAKIPVLWRPLHEAEGGWFWWGAKGPDPAKQLWRLLYDRLTNYHQIHNLIWVWNSEGSDWYPGDDVVDIVSVDSYPQPGDYSPVNQRYENLVALVQDKKLVALTENGPIPDPELLIQYQDHWSWFCTWTGEFINDGKQNSKEHIQYVLNHKYVLTLDELPKF
jgi:mannan endo-1,4-beta-mannosidase